MKTLLFVTLLMALTPVCAAILYKVVNQDGSVTYTDTPRDGAQPVDLGAVNSAVMPSIAGSLSTAQNRQVKTFERKLPDYQLSLISPTEKQTIRDNLGRLTVSAKLEPQGNGKFQLYLNDKLLQTSSAPTFKLEGVVRGEHSVVVKYVHHTGKILASSQPRIFYLKQASVLINPN